jgi:hypothetical protein
MNRKERRRLGNYDKKKTLTFTEEQLRRAIEKETMEFFREEKEKVISYTVNAMLAVLSTSMNDLHGFGKKRLNVLANKIQNQFECVLEDTVKLEEIMTEAKSIGLDIDFNWKAGGL